MVVIGNPPYNAWQKSQNDNNKNRSYPIIDHRIRETYAKDSHATNKNSLSDAYVKFFRWAVDRLQERDGIVCFVSNNSFVDQIAFDGMRKHLSQDFTQIYHLDLHGNVRQNPKLSGTTHNVFGIQVGVGITVAIRSSKKHVRNLYYYRVPEFWRKTEKFAFLRQKICISGIDWQVLEPDKNYVWITKGLQEEFDSFIPFGTKEVKAASNINIGIDDKALFKVYSRGAETNRDQWVYDFDKHKLAEKSNRMTETYNSEVSRWIRADSPKDIDDFVLADDTKIKWSSRLKECLGRRLVAKFQPTAIRNSLYRPFTRKYLYFDNIMIHRQGIFSITFPNEFDELENSVLCLSAIGSTKLFHCLVTNHIPDVHLTGDTQCFPYYTYAEDGSNRRENITDWALAQFQTQYGTEVSKWDIFHYVYAMLHHPQYRERYAENLKRELPRIPLLKDTGMFVTCVRVGKQLMELHLGYEEAQEYPLTWIEHKDVPINWRVEKMRLNSGKDILVVNEWLTLGNIPEACFQYKLGNRSALEWVIDQYQVSTDSRSGITSDPNRLDDERYIVQLLGKVITVSMETVQLVAELTQAVQQEDWMEK